MLQLGKLLCDRAKRANATLKEAGEQLTKPLDSTSGKHVPLSNVCMLTLSMGTLFLSISSFLNVLEEGAGGCLSTLN